MLLKKLAVVLASRLRIWRDIARLQSVDDGLLRDMGIERREIAARVKGRR